MKLYKLLPYKVHHWLIMHFGKPYYYEGTYILGGWVAGDFENIYTRNAYEIGRHMKKIIFETLNNLKNL